MEIKLPSINCEKVADEIGSFIVEQCLAHTGAVIGLSGGVDSALVAYLAKRVFDRDKWNSFEKKNSLVALYMPTQFNSSTSKNYAKKVADFLEIKFVEVNIAPVTNLFSQELGTSSFNSRSPDVFGNMTSRMRANVLWTVAAIEKKIVLGTGNADEDFGVGYYTLGGDGLVSCSPIGMLSKRLVYVLAKWIGVPKEIIERVPTAELEAGQTDESDLGYKYEVVELVMEAIKQHPKSTTIIATSKMSTETSSRRSRGLSKKFMKP